MSEREQLIRLLDAAFKWIDSTSFATPAATRVLVEEINRIRYPSGERTPEDILGDLEHEWRHAAIARAESHEDSKPR